MNKIDYLLKKYCPNGVEYKPLNEIGYFYGGLSGKTKEDFTLGNSLFVTYLEIFNDYSVDESKCAKVFINENEKQNKIKQGDILFTGSSETPDECAMSSVMVNQPISDLYLNSFSFGFRLNDKNLFLSSYLKYYFRGQEFRKKVNSAVNGVTRFNVSKTAFGKITIPIPPVAIQKIIANDLDNINELINNLKEELKQREKQFEYYREEMIKF